jgi:hypothetical protein
MFIINSSLKDSKISLIIYIRIRTDEDVNFPEYVNRITLFAQYFSGFYKPIKELYFANNSSISTSFNSEIPDNNDDNNNNINENINENGNNNDYNGNEIRNNNDQSNNNNKK